MTSFLDDIITYKKSFVRDCAERVPVRQLEQSPFFESPCLSLCQYLHRPAVSGVIAEIKRASPARGVLNESISIEALSMGYMRAGASALSILTDQRYFRGSGADLSSARVWNLCPILRKDFIIDEYQVLEAKSLGADVILLLACVLTPGHLKNLAALAGSLGMEVILEIHTEFELEASLCAEINIIGVNNRNLADLQVRIERSADLANRIPKEMTSISESGLRRPEDVAYLARIGFRGFLIGEAFMADRDPAAACARFIQEVQNLRKGTV